MEKNFYNLDFSKRLVSLKNSNISEVNKQLISDFVENCYAQGLGQQRVIKYISILKMIAIQINLDFDKVEKRDLFTFISQLEQSDKSEWLKHDYKIGIKKFYRWYFNDDDPEITKWIKASISNKDKKLPEDLLTEEDIKKMIDCAKKNRDKAIVALLWDIGARIGEIGNLRIKHIKFDERGATVNLKGKTGYRRVRAVFSVEYLQAWLLEHPHRNNADAPLWTTFDSKKNLMKPLHYNPISLKIKRLAMEAGINKKIHPHLFRHSRATYMAKFLTEAQMNVYFGWTLSSGMPAIYVHLSGRDVDDAVLKANHVIEKDVTTPAASTANNVTESSKLKLSVNKDVKVSTVSRVNNVAQSPKLNLSAIIEAKIDKLVEAKITELLGNSL